MLKLVWSQNTFLPLKPIAIVCLCLCLHKGKASLLRVWLPRQLVRETIVEKDNGVDLLFFLV